MDETIRSDSHAYQIFNQVAESVDYRIYVCRQDGAGRECLLQIAAASSQNGGLDRAAYLLKTLEVRATELEAEYAAIRTDPKSVLNYQLGFPEVVDTFVCREQGNRRVNVLAFRSVEKVGQMVPLRNITARDKLRVDLRSSVWIMGKLLKLLVFTHGENIAIRQLGGRNILIEPDQHYVVLFDWAGAESYPEEIPEAIRRQEIAQAAKSVITVLGGDLATGTFPDDGDPGFAKYTKFLLQLAAGHYRNAQKAHAKFYELADSLWPREFYPFTCHSLT